MTGRALLWAPLAKVATKASPNLAQLPGGLRDAVAPNLALVQLFAALPPPRAYIVACCAYRRPLRAGARAVAGRSCATPEKGERRSRREKKAIAFFALRSGSTLINVVAAASAAVKGVVDAAPGRHP